MRFAGDHDLHRPLGIGQHPLQPLDIAEQQRGALVGGEAARETDGEACPDRALRPDAAARPPEPCGPRRAADHALAHEGHQVALAAAMRFPQFLRRECRPPGPRSRVGIALAPVRLQVLIVELRQIAVEPGQQMHAVGDGGDGHFPHRQLGPQLLPHFLRDLAMQAADRVAEGRGLNGADGHGKRLVVILGTEAAQRQELLERNARSPAILAEVLVHQAGIEQIDAGRHRGVRGEDVVGAAGFERLLESQACAPPSARRMRSMARNAEWPSFM